MFGGMSESVAVLVTVNNVNSAIVRFVCAESTGALFVSVTTTVKRFVALRGGDPLSVTTVVIRFVPGPWPSDGVHEMTPLASIIAPLGALSSAYVRMIAGISVSVAAFVTISKVS